jgi:NAD(P)-dependent dehydrogenase (short-subunit alcohol dehydrogenase family)
VTDAGSVAAAAKWVEQEYGRLDVLVNNAGVLLERGEKPSETTAEKLRRTYETNVIGVVVVTSAMLPLLRRAPAARIVNVSSELGSLSLTSDPTNAFSQFPLLAYNSSKSALNAITVSYANELRGTSIKVNAADPGYCATDLNAHSGPRTAAQGANAAVALATLDGDGPTGGLFNEDGPVPW